MKTEYLRAEAAENHPSKEELKEQEAEFRKGLTSGAEPHIIFSVYDARDWWVSPEVTFQEMEKLRRRVKTAARNMWDNSHFHIADTFGKIALDVLFEEDSISAWDHVTQVSLGDVGSYEQLKKLVSLTEKGQIPCNECGTPTARKVIKHFSFAGGVCRKCFNPKEHMPPDTRGD